MARSRIHLESVRIDGFRSCDGTAFSPHRELSVLIGPNGSGKSNLLQGIALLAAWLTPTAASAERAGRRAAGDARVTAAFRAGDQAMALRSTVRVREGAEAPDGLLALKDEYRIGGLPETDARGWVEVPFPFLLGEPGGSTARRGGRRKGPMDRPLTLRFMQFYAAHQREAEQIAAFRRGIRYYSASQFTNPALCPSALELDADGVLVGPVDSGRAHRQFVFDLYQSQTHAPAQYAAYVDLVGPRGLNLVSALHWQEARPVAGAVPKRRRRGSARREPVWVIPTVTRDADRLSYRQLSEGTLRALALVFYLLADDTDLLMLEEPEVGVHRGLLGSLLELIRSQSRRTQILISTHAEVVLDAVEPEHVFVVARTARGKTTVRGLAEDYSAKDLASLREYLRNEGSLGEYWRTFGLES
jgi:ABC-type branched-subunit amino acid transport system ATPase component